MLENLEVNRQSFFRQSFHLILINVNGLRRSFGT